MPKKIVAPAELPDENGDNQVAKKKPEATIQITPPNMMAARFALHGTTHLCVERFSMKSKAILEKIQKAGSQARSRKQREPKDFEELFELARYRDLAGWDGVNVSCIRNASIAACRLVGFKMVLAKLTLFTQADGHDREDGTPLMRIYSEDGQPKNWIAPVRNSTGVIDLRPRPRWDPGTWRLEPVITWDADAFSLTDVTNLLMRVGRQVGICEGRPDSRNSPGMGYGLFEVELASGVNREEEEKAA
jgi:hypothetical protein